VEGREVSGVLLVYPGRRGGVPRLPLSVLYLAGELERAGFKPQVVDTRVDELSGIKLDDVVCAGVSSMTGNQIAYGLEAAEFIREKNPDLPIVWGGVHPSIDPKQTIQDGLVDVVVSGEGEEALVEVARKLEAGKTLKGVKGVTFKEGRKIKSNPDRGFMDFNKVGLPAYHLIDLSKYPKALESFGIQSSRGCPHPCKFCYNLCFNKLKWRARKPRLVVEDLKVLHERYGVRVFNIVDDNFFVDEKRVKAVCEGLAKEKLDCEWMSSCRIDYLKGYDKRFLGSVKKSGCFKIRLGAESGSQRILDLVRKDITPAETLAATKKCVKSDLTPVLSMIVGFPTETWKDVEATLTLYDKLRAAGERVEINGIFLYTPYPGTPLFDLAVEHGFKPPASLKAWGGWKFNYRSDVPWLSGEHKDKTEKVSYIARFNFFKQELALRDFGPATGLARLFNKFFEPSARARWRGRNFRFGLEWDLWALAARTFLGNI